MIKIKITAIFLFVSISIFAQDFTGTVLDNETKQAIPFAQVYFVDLKTGTTTDQEGKFKIEKFNQKIIHIQIYSVGYKTIDQIVNCDTLKEQLFYLEHTHFELQEILVSAPTGRLQGENSVSIEQKK